MKETMSVLAVIVYQTKELLYVCSVKWAAFSCGIDYLASCGGKSVVFRCLGGGSCVCFHSLQPVPWSVTGCFEV